MSSLDDFLMRSLDAGLGDTVVFNPQIMAKELIAYGEHEAAVQITQLQAKDLHAIGRRAHEIWSDFTEEHGPMLDKAICKAIVEHLEGKPRELKRKRRVFSKKEM